MYGHDFWQWQGSLSADIINKAYPTHLRRPQALYEPEKMLAHHLRGKRRPIPPSPDATPPFTPPTPDDNTPPMKQPRHSITNFLVSQSSQQQPSSQKIRHQKPLPSANRKPTITQFLTPQMSNQQPAIKRTYLQALIDKATEEQQQQPQEQNQRKRTSQPNPQSQSYTLIPQLDLSNHMTFSTTIASTWRKADELLFQTEQVGNVKIATWNSNHLTDKKAEHIAWYICATQIDITFIQDTRLTQQCTNPSATSSKTYLDQKPS